MSYDAEIDRIQRCCDYRGWDSYGALEVTPAAAAFAKTVAVHFPPGLGVTPTTAGQFSFENGVGDFIVTIEPNGSVSLYVERLSPEMIGVIAGLRDGTLGAVPVERAALAPLDMEEKP